LDVLWFRYVLLHDRHAFYPPPRQTHVICAASTANEQSTLKMIPTEKKVLLR